MPEQPKVCNDGHPLIWECPHQARCTAPRVDLSVWRLNSMGQVEDDYIVRDQRSIGERFCHLWECLVGSQLNCEDPIAAGKRLTKLLAKLNEEIARILANELALPGPQPLTDIGRLQLARELLDILKGE